MPVPDVVLDRDHVDLTGSVGDTVTRSFSIANRANCSVTLEKERASLNGITVDCPKWSLAGRDSIVCTISASMPSAAKRKDRLLLAARVGEDCKQSALAIVARREKSELAPLEDELLKLRRATLDDPYGEAKLQEKKLQETYEAAIKELTAQEATAERHATEQHAVYAEILRVALLDHEKRIRKQRVLVDVAQTDDSAMRAFDARLAQLRKDAQREIDAVHAKRVGKCEAVRTFRDERDVDMDELRRGAWHDLCKRTESQIVKDEKITLAEHLRKEGGEMKPVPQEVIDAREEQWEAKIDAARAECTALNAQETETTQRWVQTVRTFDAQRGDVRRRQQQAFEDARADLVTLEANGRILATSMRAKHEDIDRKLAARKEELQASRTELDKKLVRDKQTLREDLAKAEQLLRDKVNQLQDRIGKLRTELLTFANNIRNAHQQAQHLGVDINVTFAP